MKSFKWAFAFTFLYCCSSHAIAETIYVIANKAHGVPLAKQDVVEIFQGTKRKMNDWRVEVLDQDASSATRIQFYKGLYNKSVADMSTYWAELIFSGKAKPPAKVEDDQAVIQYVQSKPNAIGYVSDKSKLPVDTIIVYRLD